MFGALAGDIIGSRFEFSPTQETNVKLFHNACSWTDDTVCTASVAKSTLTILELINTNSSILFPLDFNKIDSNQTELIHSIFFKDFTFFVNLFPMAGYGKYFYNNIKNQQLGNSKGNGCLMRISPIPFLSNDIDQAKTLAQICTQTTHNDIDSLFAVNLFIEFYFEIKKHINQKNFNYSKEQIDILKNNLKLFLNNLNFHYNTIEHYHNNHKYEPLAINTLKICFSVFFESTSIMNGFTNMLYIGGDTDTNCAILGSLLELIYPLSNSELKELEKYFNHKNNILINIISKTYVNNPLTSKLYPNSLHIINSYLTFNPPDLTAAFDPLEMPSDDEYHKLEKIINNNILDKILKIFSKYLK